MSKASNYGKKWKQKFGDQTVNPLNFHEQLEQDRAAVKLKNRPADSITIAEYAELFKMTKERARGELNKLQEAGIYEFVAGLGNRYYPGYYVRVKGNGQR